MINLRNGLSVVNAAIACSVVLTTTSEATANNEDKPSSTSSETKTTVEKPFLPRKLHGEPSKTNESPYVFKPGELVNNYHPQTKTSADVDDLGILNHKYPRVLKPAAIPFNCSACEDSETYEVPADADMKVLVRDCVGGDCQETGGAREGPPKGT